MPPFPRLHHLPSLPHLLLLLILLFFAIPSAAFSTTTTPPQAGLGFDFGTSGVRITVLENNDKKTPLFEASTPWPSPTAVQDVNAWREALFGLLNEIPPHIRAQIARIAVSGTSASSLVVNRQNGAVTRPARLYNWDALRESKPASVGKDAQMLLQEYAPPRHTTLSGTSALMKVLAWQLEEAFHAEEVMLHQADFLAGWLMHDDQDDEAAFPRVSDWNNMLKLGYDVEGLCYPSWFTPLFSDARLKMPQQKDSFREILPSKVVEPGQVMGAVSSSLITKLGFPLGCQVVGGTTDSIAAFLASGADKPGQAVSSLGSTLAVKMLSTKAVEDASRGVYSHRLGGLWLVGGASNVGCAVLREQGFSNEELVELSHNIDPQNDIPLNYYPLAGTAGERFPTCDPEKKALLTPRPDSRTEYLWGILQGIARVEKEGYDILKELGADPLVEVLTAGGGSNNPTWTKMRERILGVPTTQAQETDAAYGAALLALKTVASASL